MVNVSFFNENGNVSVKVRDGIRPQILDKVIGVLADSEQFEEVAKNANGGITIPVAVDRSTGKTIYAHFDMTVNDNNGMTKKVRKKTAKKKTMDEVEIPDIFGTDDEDEDEE